MPIGFPPSSGGGGSSTPGLPVWTFTSGAMASGKLKANNANPQDTTTLQLSQYAKNGAGVDFAAVLGSASGSSWIVLTNSSGQSVFLQITGASNSTTYVELTVSATTAAAGSAWSGDYQVSFITPGVGWGQISGSISDNNTLDSRLFASADNSYSPNADNGTPGFTVPSSATATAAAGELNGLSCPNTAAVLEAVAERLKAVEHTLSQRKYPGYP